MLRITGRNPERFNGDLLVFGVVGREGKSPRLTGPLRKVIRSLWKEGKFQAKEGEQVLLYPTLGTSPVSRYAAGRIMLLALGTEKEGKNDLREQVRSWAGTVAVQARKLGAETVMVVAPEVSGLKSAALAEALSEGLVLGNYRFARYRNRDNDQGDKPVTEFLLTPVGGTSFRRGAALGSRAARAACSARDMANEPGNVWTPQRFADQGRALARDHQEIHCRVLDLKSLKKLGMGGLLAVNQGSHTPPVLVCVEYIVDPDRPTLLLVGKGLTFDSGGVSLKPAAGMEEMKYDMCGGAAVLAAMEAVAEERPSRLNVVALVPATDNMGGGSALKPGDVITHYGGKTSEIINTDAEGRLILADALAYGIEKYSPQAVIDLATLTGAVIIGLGHHNTGLMSNNDLLAGQIIRAGERTGEPFWRLPLGPAYSKQIESKIADLKNTGGRAAGTCTAAAYLQEFVGETPWAHCDIAGTAWNFTEKSYVPKGPSGIAVRTLINLIRNWKPLSRR